MSNDARPDVVRLPRRQEKETGQNQRAGEHQYLRGREERGWTMEVLEQPKDWWM